MKKALSLILVLVMLIGMMPMQALATEGTEENPWKGRSAVFVGDSITAGSGTTKIYYQYLEEAFGFGSVTAMGVAGSCVSTASDYGHSNQPLIDRYQTIPSADLIVVFMGTNDYAHETPLGGMADAQDGTFYGALNVIIPALVSQHSSRKIVFVTPLHRYGFGTSKILGTQFTYDDVANGVGATLGDYVDALKTVCGNYDVSVIDLYTECTLDPADAEIRTNYMPDGLHPNAAGHELIAGIMESHIRNIEPAEKVPEIETDPAEETALIYGNKFVSGFTQQNRASARANQYLKAGTVITLKNPETFQWACVKTNGEYSSDNLGYFPDSAWSDKETAVVTENGWVGFVFKHRDETRVFDLTKPLTDYISIEEPHIHSYEATVTAPTCTEQGYTTYTCTCGDRYVADYTDATGHRYDRIVCTICGYKYPDEITELGSDLEVTVTPDNYLTISNPVIEKLACAPNLVAYGEGIFAVAYLADDVNTVETESSTTIVCRLGLFDVDAPESGTFFDIATAGQKIGSVTIGSKAPYEPNLLKLSGDALLVLFNIRDTSGNYVYYSAKFDTVSNTVTSYQPLTLDGKNWTPANIAASYNALAENDISTSGPTSSMVFTSRIVQHDGYYYGYCGGICSGFSGMLVRSTDGINWTSVMVPEALPEMAGVIECGFEFLDDYVYFCMRDISSGVYHCSYDFKTGEQLTKTSKLSGITTSKPTAFTQDGNLYLIVNKATGDDNSVGRRNTALFYQVNPETCRLTLVRQVFCADGVAYHSVVNFNGINYWSFHTDARRINPYTQGRSNLAFLQIPELYVAEGGSADGVLNLNDYSDMFARGCITVANNAWQAGAVNMHYQIPVADFSDFDTVTITANSEQKAYIAFFTDRMTQNGTIAYAEGWTEQLIMDPGTVQTMTIPENAAYLYILNNNAAGANLLPESVVFSKMESEQHTHSYTPTVTAPTCTEQGYSTYTCACGDSYVADYVDPTGEHSYKNGICIDCGDKDSDGLSLDGLNVLCLGDSITAGQGLTTDTRWTNVLASKYGWNLTNKSQGGISLSSYYYTTNGQTDVSIAKKAEVLKTMTTKPDVIIVWGGHNDTSYRASPLGSWEDDTTDSFKGALKYIAELAEEYAPDAALFVLTPIWNNENPSSLKLPENTTDTSWMFVDAIYEGAEKYGWIPINMDLCGITPYEKSKYFLDNIHPNAVGTELIVEFLSEELASYGANSKKDTVILNQTSVSLEVGQKATVKAVLTPRSGYNAPVFTWNSSNTDVATFSSSGVITAVAHGNATITATTDNGVSATVKVSVAEGEHIYSTIVTAPTCTEQGYSTYTCACGDSYVADYVDVTGEHSYENGVCTSCGANAPVTAKPMSMRYDDHLDMSGKVVEIIDAGTPTSYQVGYGVEENKVLDTAVVTLKGNTLVATGIGTAKVKIDGTLYEITVTAAPISLLLLIGQSNMEGNEGEAKQSIVCPDGMVYATYGDRYDMVLENATHYAPSALTGEYRTVNTVGGTDGLCDYPVYMLTDEGDGRKGPDSGFAYEWVKQTGEKLWIVNAAHGGTSLDVWQPGTTQYEECQAMFGACQETLRKEIAAGHFTLSHMAYFWCQGCNDYTKTAEWYVEKYLSMHESLNAEMAFDHDSDASTPAKQFELAGIIPVRAGHSWSNGYRAGTHTDSTNKSSYESFVDLQMTGPRVAQYWMCNNPELDDIVLVCNIGEDWVWMPDGTNGVSAYFNAHYPNGTVDYTTQVQQSASWYKPTTPNAVHDSIHYNQIGYNEVGRESVRNALIYLGINPDYEEETTVKFVDWTGYREVSEIEAATTGSSGTLVVPIVSPVTRSKTVSYTFSEGLSYEYYDLLANSVNTLGQLQATGTANCVTVIPRSLDSYTWNFNGTNLVSDPAEGDMNNSLTLLGGSITDGLFNGIRYKISRSICLNHDSEWGVELRISDWSATAGSMIFSSGSAATSGQPFVYFRPTDFFVGFGYYDGTQYNNYGVSLKNYGIACNEGTHTYCFVNRIAADGTNAIWLYVDGEEIAPLTEYYVNSTLTDANSNGLSGKDFVLSYIGTSDFTIKGCVIDGIRVVETGYDPGIHLHTWSEWETASLPSPKGPGLEQRICSECGKTQNREVEGVWQKYDLDDHMVDLPEKFCAETNLWSLLPHDSEYYHSGVRWDVNGNVHSVTFTVSGGERIFATSFGKRGTNGTSSSDGIRLTFFGENGVLKTTSPQETYAEFVANGGYIIVPEGAIAVNIPMYSNGDENELYILNRDHIYENGTCAGCGEKEPITAIPMSMQYDDHLDMSGKVVEIIDAGTPTSYQVGYSVEENKVLDTAVVTLKGNTLVATGIGTAKVKIDGALYEITVTAAPISLLLLIGQSNMRGSEGNADQSIVCPDGMVYATFGDDRGDAEGIMNVNNATNFAASALTGDYSAVNVNGTTDNLSYYPINSLTEAGKGTFGPDSGFAYEWVKQTGEKVWVVNAAHGGSAISSWQPNATNFKEAVLLFGACQETLRKEIAAGHFTLSHMGYFWCQGCNDASMTAETYVQKYLAMHDGLNTSLDFDHDSNDATAEISFEFAGIIPILYGVNSYRAGEYKDKNTYTYYQSFEQLTFNGPRVAQYWMCNNPELEDIWMVCNIGEDWVWMPDGTNGVSEYFQSHYTNGTVDYTTQVVQKASWYTPTTPAAVHDSIHYNQIGYNEVGRESARNALIMLGEIEAPEVEAIVELLSWDGYTSVNKISASLTGNSSTLVIPKVYPVWKSKEVSYTLTEGFNWSYYDILASDEGLAGELTMGGQTVTIDGHNWSDWETLYEASAAGPGKEERVCSHCCKVETRKIDGVWQIYALNDHLLELPEGICSDTNLWAILPHEDVHFTSGKTWGRVSVPAPSVTIPINAGDRIYATSFLAKGDNGGPHNGIRLTFFDANGVAWSVDPTAAYKEWVKNGYIEAPEGTIAANIPMWYDSEDYELYILNRDHIYENGTCAGCGDHIGPVITHQPESVEQEVGKKFAVTVKAEGEGLRYQWYYKDAGMKNFGISSNKTSAYAYTMQTYMHNRQVYCVVTDAYGNQVTTETATITRPPLSLKIVEQPQGVQVNMGEKFSVKPTVQGDGLTYQWYYKNPGMKNFAASSNKSASYAYTMASYMVGRQVYCVITDKYGNEVTTDVATISLPPVELKILTQPTDASAPVGTKFSISFEVQGDGLTYQWYVKESGAKAFKVSSNKTSAYAYTMQSYMNNRQVYCVITDQYGNQVTTETVTIHVTK